MEAHPNLVLAALFLLFTSFLLMITQFAMLGRLFVKRKPSRNFWRVSALMWLTLAGSRLCLHLSDEDKFQLGLMFYFQCFMALLSIFTDTRYQRRFDEYEAEANKQNTPK